MHKGKRYQAALERVDREHLYSPAEAVDLLEALAPAQLDETVELAASGWTPAKPTRSSGAR